MIAASRIPSRALNSAVWRDQVPYASHAASSARSASAIPAAAETPTISVGSDGLTLSIVSPVSTASPAMTIGYDAPKRSLTPASASS